MIMPRLAIVVPCFNEQEVLEKTVIRLEGVLSDLIFRNSISEKSFICFIDDGSTDKTWDLVVGASQHSNLIRGLKLSRNFGHQNALLAGLLRVADCCDCAISVDADLQQNESAIIEFIGEYSKGIDIVFGVRTDRSTDSLIKSITANFFYGLMSLLGVCIIKNHADYRLMSQRALKALEKYEEDNLFLRGMVHHLGYKTSVIFFNVRNRKLGESKYTFIKMLKFALNAITSFSIVPLRLISVIGIIMTIFSFAMLVYILIQKFIYNDTVPGWASIALPIYILGGIQLFSLGIIGEYVGRIYIESKRRPRFIIEEDLVG